MKTKVCSKCLIEKPVSEFTPYKIRKYGFRPECKQCRMIKQREYYKTHRKQCLKQKVDYYNSERGQEIINKYRQSQKGRESQRCSSKKARKNCPERITAERAVELAVRSGKFPKASTHKCVICGKQAMDYHHDRGYFKKHWLKVIPVCRKCHAMIHSKYSPSQFVKFTP